MKQRHRQLILDVLNTATSPLSAMQIAAQTSINYIQVGKRTGELLGDGKIKVFDRRGISPSGHVANRYAVVVRQEDKVQTKLF